MGLNNSELVKVYDAVRSDPNLKKLYELRADILENNVPVLRINPKELTCESFYPYKVQKMLDHNEWCIKTYIKSTYNLDI